MVRVSKLKELDSRSSNKVDKEEFENIISYNNHAITMSEIAVSLLSGYNPLNVRGVRELLAMYLLVPYITKSQLDTPSEKYNIPQLKLDSLFTKVINKDGSMSEMTLDGLRNALCHSFVALTDKGDLLLDDRASCSDRKTHDALDDKGFCNRLELDKTRNKLLSLHKKVIQKQIEFHTNLLEHLEVQKCV